MENHMESDSLFWLSALLLFVVNFFSFVYPFVYPFGIGVGQC